MTKPRGYVEHDWQHWSLVYHRRLRKLMKLICAEGYEVHCDADSMPTKLVRAAALSSANDGAAR